MFNQTNDFRLEYSIADELQRLDTNVMNIDQCTKTHKYSGFPVRKRKNVCAGGEKGVITRIIECKFLKVKITLWIDNFLIFK